MGWHPLRKMPWRSKSNTFPQNQTSLVESKYKYEVVHWLEEIARTMSTFKLAGVTPLVLASGAGAEVRQVMGVTVASGMLGVTFFGLFFTPVFYVVMRRLVAAREQREAA